MSLPCMILTSPTSDRNDARPLRFRPYKQSPASRRRESRAPSLQAKEKTKELNIEAL